MFLRMISILSANFFKSALRCVVYRAINIVQGFLRYFFFISWGAYEIVMIGHCVVKPAKCGLEGGKVDVMFRLKLMP
jgi:hypothetical protein